MTINNKYLCPVAMKCSFSKNCLSTDPLIWSYMCPICQQLVHQTFTDCESYEFCLYTSLFSLLMSMSKLILQSLLSESAVDDQHWPKELILLREKFTAKSQLEITQLNIKHAEEVSPSSL